MMVVALIGGRRDLIYRSLVSSLASSGYRVAVAVKERRLGLIKEMKELAEAGAGLIVAHSPSRAMISTTYVPETLEDVKKAVGCLVPVKPDVLILLGYDEMVKEEGEVLKALSVWSAKEAELLLSNLSPPIVGVYSDRGDYEGGCSSPEELSNAIIEEGMRRGLIQPRVLRP